MTVRRAIVYSMLATAVCQPAGCASKPGANPTGPAKVRPAAVAGTFYPADPTQLRSMIDQLLSRAQPPKIEGELIGLISPHAGYVYSGGVAAHGYALLRGMKYERVVVISPSHIDFFNFSAVYDGDAYETPLGQIPVDKEFAQQLAAADRSIRLSDRGHRVAAGQAEHALEVQLPFLQVTLGQFRLVPIVMGDQRYELCRALGVALAKTIGNSKTLIVASSDLSHYHPYAQATSLDQKTLRAIQEWDYLSLSRNFEAQVWEACGGGPIIAAMIAAERLGAKQAILAKYANSGDVTGDKSRVVGYGSVALVKPARRAQAVEPAFELSEDEQKTLLEIARKSVETAVKEHRLYECPAPTSERLLQERGAFVTLKKHGQLRGCIGYVAPLKPLYLTVRDVAALAATRDPRFQPVKPDELPLLEYEISVLSPLRRVLSINEVQVGRDGLVVRKGDAEGLLLPQVPVEQGWDRETFLRETCIKAGLHPEAWKEPSTDIFRFTAFVFTERGPQRFLTVKRPPSD